MGIGVRFVQTLSCCAWAVFDACCSLICTCSSSLLSPVLNVPSVMSHRSADYFPDASSSHQFAPLMTQTLPVTLASLLLSPLCVRTTSSLLYVSFPSVIYHLSNYHLCSTACLLNLLRLQLCFIMTLTPNWGSECNILSYCRWQFLLLLTVVVYLLNTRWF